MLYVSQNKLTTNQLSTFHPLSFLLFFLLARFISPSFIFLLPPSYSVFYPLPSLDEGIQDPRSKVSARGEKGGTGRRGVTITLPVMYCYAILMRYVKQKGKKEPARVAASIRLNVMILKKQ